MCVRARKTFISFCDHGAYAFRLMLTRILRYIQYTNIESKTDVPFHTTYEAYNLSFMIHLILYTTVSTYITNSGKSYRTHIALDIGYSDIGIAS